MVAASECALTVATLNFSFTSSALQRDSQGWQLPVPGIYHQQSFTAQTFYTFAYIRLIDARIHVDWKV